MQERVFQDEVGDWTAHVARLAPSPVPDAIPVPISEVQH